MAVSFLFCICAFARDQEETGYELVSYNAALHIFPQSNAISCVDTLLIELHADKIGELAFALMPMYDVDYLSIGGKRVEALRKNDYILIHDIPSVSRVSVVMKYSGTLTYRSEFTRLTPERAVFREEEILPQCPARLESTKLTIIVPREWKTVASGRLIAVDSLHDSTSYTWQCDQQIESSWICAGPYWGGEKNSGGVSVCRFDKDSVSNVGIASLARDALTYYSTKFIPYRFPKLTVVEVEDWVAGKNVLAVAAPSFIMVKHVAFTTTDRFDHVESILPHEVAHQWWPMTVSLDEEDNAFLSEGMCEYSALLFNEAHGAQRPRDTLNHHPLLRPLLLRAIDGKDLPLQRKADLRSLPTHYLKACYVHNMLRRLIGDSLFFQLYHEFAKRFALKKAGMNDFRKIAEQLTGKNLGWFFDQWVKGRGIPRLKLYNVKSARNGPRWFVRGRVRIVGYDKYSTFADVGIETLSGIRKVRVWLGVDSTGSYHNDVSFDITVDTQPVRALLDPDSDILKLQEMPVKFSDLRDPSDGLMIVGSLQHTEYLLALARKDSASMDKGGWSMAIKYDSSITLGDLQKERVMLYGRVSENSIVAGQQSKFPLNFRGDSITVNGETIFDSSLAVMQIIDNPYASHGVIGWIAPLSEKAEPELIPFDASWVIVKGKDQISSGTWGVKDKDLEVELN